VSVLLLCVCVCVCGDLLMCRSHQLSSHIHFSDRACVYDDQCVCVCVVNVGFTFTEIFEESDPLMWFSYADP